MPVKSHGKWLSEDTISNVQVNWENAYTLPFLCTVEIKLRVFQFKFIHRRIATNDFLHKIGKKESDSSTFCVDDAIFPFVNKRCHLKRLMPFLRTVDAVGKIDARTSQSPALQCRQSTLVTTAN